MLWGEPNRAATPVPLTAATLSSRDTGVLVASLPPPHDATLTQKDRNQVIKQHVARARLDCRISVTFLFRWNDKNRRSEQAAFAPDRVWHTLWKQAHSDKRTKPYWE
jgi:hypothetical protein